jgi:predicted TIM-barrel fold metal-dependent hydrolase
MTSHPLAMPGDPQSGLTRREFLTRAGAPVLVCVLSGCRTTETAGKPEPIIDIHQHVNYAGRSDEDLIAHQRTMGVTRTILLPAGRPINTTSTHDGSSNGLQAKCAGNQSCYDLAAAHAGEFSFGANEVPDIPDAVNEMRHWLKAGAIVIGEQKFGLECDSPEMRLIYDLAAERRVPVLMHWQFKMYNYGFERFHKILQAHPRTLFIGHAQTWWANIDRNHADQSVLYPKGKVTSGGLTDRYLADYPNMFGDLSAGSGLNAMTRDEDHAREFLDRHQHKLMYGSDCDDRIGSGPACSGSQMIAAIRRLSPTIRVERALLHENAARLLKIT